MSDWYCLSRWQVTLPSGAYEYASSFGVRRRSTHKILYLEESPGLYESHTFLGKIRVARNDRGSLLPCEEQDGTGPS